MEKYTTPVKKNAGGSPIHLWYEQAYANNTSWTGDEQVSIIGPDGQPKLHPRRDVALLFRDLKTQRVGNTDITSYYSNVGGNAVTAKFVALVSGSETYIPAFSHTQADKNRHLLTQNRKGWIPWAVQPVPHLNSNDDQNIRTQTVWQQNARTWVSGGQVDIDMNDQHVANMLVSQQACLLYQLSRTFLSEYLYPEQWDPARIQELFLPLLLHLESIPEYLNIFPQTRKPIEALCRADFATDIMHRMIAGYLTDYQFTPLNLFRSLELVVRRIFKHHGYETNLSQELLPGVWAILVFPPLIQKWKSGEWDTEKLITELYQRGRQIITAQAEIKTSEHWTQDQKNYRHLYVMVQHSLAGPHLTLENFRKIYEWMHVKENYLKDVPLRKLGLLPELKLPFSCETRELTIKGNRLLNQTQLDHTFGDRYTLLAKSPVDWTGVMFSDPGRYFLTPEVIGDAYPRDSGHDWYLMCGLNFTSGKEVLPVRREMFNDSGQYWCSQDRKARKFQNKLKLDREIELRIEEKTYSVYQRGIRYFHGKHRRNTLLCFKNLALTLKYESLDNPIEIKDNKRFRRLVNERVDKYQVYEPEFHECSPTEGAVLYNAFLIPLTENNSTTHPSTPVEG